MTMKPDGWSVDVDVENVFVTFPTGDSVARLELSQREARVLRNQLDLASLLAGRNVWSAGDFSEGSSADSVAFNALIRDRLELRRVGISDEERAELWARHRERVKLYIEQLEPDAAQPETATPLDERENPETGAQAGEVGSGTHVGARRSWLGPATQLPRGWRIELASQLIKFVVPASGIDGEFGLTDAEALATGVRLIQLSALARSVHVAMEEAGE